MTGEQTTETQRYDAIVIGGGVGGLTAAAYLARAGLRTVLVEARDKFGGRAESAVLTTDIRAPVLAHIVYGLDDRVVRQLGLQRHGLRYAEREMPLVGLRLGGRHLVLERPLLSAIRAIHAEAAADARAYWRYRREILRLARRLQPLWTPKSLSADRDVTFETLPVFGRDARRLAHYARSSASALLDTWFESDVLKAALAADACIDGLSPQEAGSALALLWRAAQTSGSRRGAVRQVIGGPGSLASALAAAAQQRGAELRSSAHAAEILVEEKRVAGVRLTGGEILRAPIVLSGIGTRSTFLKLLPADAVPFGLAERLAGTPRLASAKLDFALNGLPPFAGLAESALAGRLLVAPRPETAAEAKGAALTGTLPAELILEVTIPTVADTTLAGEGRHVVSVRVPYMPVQPQGGWAQHRDALRKRVLATLEAYAPGLGDRVKQSLVITPEDIAALYGEGDDAITLPRLLSSYGRRMRTPVAGLYLCGAAAEPFDVISGRAGRLAASLAVEYLRRGRRR